MFRGHSHLDRADLHSSWAWFARSGRRCRKRPFIRLSCAERRRTDRHRYAESGLALYHLRRSNHGRPCLYAAKHYFVVHRCRGTGPTVPCLVRQTSANLVGTGALIMASRSPPQGAARTGRRCSTVHCHFGRRFFNPFASGYLMTTLDVSTFKLPNTLSTITEARTYRLLRYWCRQPDR